MFLACFLRVACMFLMFRSCFCSRGAMWDAFCGTDVVRPQRAKVPTHGFSAKKEGVWCDLRVKSADSRIFGEKGNNVAQPIFGENRNGVARPLPF